MKMRIVILGLLLIFVQIALLAQNSTNSPYTIYGYGELSDPSFGAQKAMGGIGYGLREANIINPLNPASFSRVDSMTFMLDMALSLQRSSFDDGMNKSKNTNARLDYVAMQFPLSKNVGMGIGFKPISQVGYKFGETYPDSIKSYTGSGGLNQVYGALSYSFNNISVGVSAGYLFGNVYHQGHAYPTLANSFPVIKADTLTTSGLLLDFGIQYTYPIGKDQRIVIGAVYTPKLTINGNYSGSEFTYNSSGVIQSTESLPAKGSGYQLPETYALGFSYAKGNKFLVGADYSLQRWADVEYEGQKTFNDRTKINFGGEFTPNARGRNYLGRIHYRLGGNYADSYVSPKVKDTPYKFNQYGVSCGLGLPLVGGRSMLNLAFEYAEVKPEKDVTGLINEQYFKFTVSYTFNEMWFFQRKVQ